jgi:hypothetical protein
LSQRQANAHATYHDTKEVLLCDLSRCILVHLHQSLGVRANGNDHAPGARKLFHERRGDRPRGRTHVNSLVGAFLRVPCTTIIELRLAAEGEQDDAPSLPSPVTSTTTCPSSAAPSPSARMFDSANAVSTGICSMPTTVPPCGPTRW